MEPLADQPSRVDLVSTSPELAGSPQRPPARFLGWTLTVLFITAAIVCNALVLTWVNVAGTTWSQPPSLLGLSLVFAQQGLVAMVCGFGRQHFLFRTLLFLSSAVIAGVVGGRCEGRSDIPGTWIVMMVCHGLVVLAFVWCLRIAGWRLRLQGEVDSAAASPWQFSLGRLFALTTSVAIILGIGQRLSIEGHLMGRMMLIAFLLAAVPIPLCFLALSLTRWAWVVLGGFAAVLATGLALELILGPPGPNRFALFYLTLLQGMIVLGSLSIVRLAGYSISRQ